MCTVSLIVPLAFVTRVLAVNHCTVRSMQRARVPDSKDKLTERLVNDLLDKLSARTFYGGNDATSASTYYGGHKGITYYGGKGRAYYGGNSKTSTRTYYGGDTSKTYYGGDDVAGTYFGGKMSPSSLADLDTTVLGKPTRTP